MVRGTLRDSTNNQALTVGLSLRPDGLCPKSIFNEPHLPSEFRGPAVDKFSVFIQVIRISFGCDHRQGSAISPEAYRFFENWNRAGTANPILKLALLYFAPSAFDGIRILGNLRGDC